MAPLDAGLFSPLSLAYPRRNLYCPIIRRLELAMGRVLGLSEIGGVKGELNQTCDGIDREGLR